MSKLAATIPINEKTIVPVKDKCRYIGLVDSKSAADDDVSASQIPNESKQSLKQVGNRKPAQRLFDQCDGPFI